MRLQQIRLRYVGAQQRVGGDSALLAKNEAFYRRVLSIIIMDRYSVASEAEALGPKTIWLDLLLNHTSHLEEFMGRGLRVAVGEWDAWLATLPRIPTNYPGQKEPE